MKPQIFRGGPFGSLKRPPGTVVITDAQLVGFVMKHGCVPAQVSDAKYLLIELGHLRARNDAGAGALFELLISRHQEIGRRPDLHTGLLVHTDDPRLAWHYSRSPQVEALLEELEATVEEFRGTGTLGFTTISRMPEADNGAYIGGEDFVDEQIADMFPATGSGHDEAQEAEREHDRGDSVDDDLDEQDS